MGKTFPLMAVSLLFNLFAVDLGGSLAVASRGLFATGVSTDLNVTYLSSGGKIGDLIKAEVTCDKCEFSLSFYADLPFTFLSLFFIFLSRIRPVPR
jgi:acyl-coenzyme A thioesterase 13